MVRGSLPLMVILFNYIKEDFYSVPSDGVLTAAIIVGIITFTLAIYSTLTIEETHNKDLNFIE